MDRGKGFPKCLQIVGSSTPALEPSDVLSRVKAFLPQLQDANEKLKCADPNRSSEVNDLDTMVSLSPVFPGGLEDSSDSESGSDHSHDVDNKETNGPGQSEKIVEMSISFQPLKGDGDTSDEDTVSTTLPSQSKPQKVFVEEISQSSKNQSQISDSNRLKSTRINSLKKYRNRGLRSRNQNPRRGSSSR